MRISFRHGVVSHQTGSFLQISGTDVNILAINRPLTLTIAHKTTDYVHSEDNSITSAWTGITQPNHWLYCDFNPLTFARTFGHTTLDPIAQSAIPGSGDAVVIGATPGAAGFGSFLVNQFYELAVGRVFTITGSTANDGSYTVSSIVYNPGTGETTINVDEMVNSSIADGTATLDIDSFGNPLLIEGRHWFDTASNVHFVRTLNIWTPVIRVFIARIINATTIMSVSQNSSSGDFTGTQIGNNNSVFAGRVLFDESGSPILRDDRTFFTTEDQFFVNQSRVDAIRLEANVTRAQSIAPSMAEFSIVAWTATGQINVAQYSDVGNTIVGLLTENVVNLEVGAVIVQGTVTNPLWNWTGGLTPTTIGSPLWVENGLLVTTDPYITAPITNPVQTVPVARVLTDDTVIFEQGLGGVGPAGPPGSITGFPPADTSILGGVTLTTPSSDPLRAFVISDLDPRLTNARAPLAHTHQATDVTFTASGGLIANNLQDAVVELDTEKVNLAGDNMLGFLTLVADPVNPLQAATKQYVDAITGGSAHSSLTGLLADDHTQYFNEARGDARYYTQVLLNGLLDTKVDLAGDTMTGFLTLNADPVNVLHATTKQYVDTLVNAKVDLAGDTMTGFLTLNADPVNVLHATTKQYVDTLVNVKVDLAGDTMTGLLTLSADPVNPLQAATKQYVDANDGYAPLTINTQAGTAYTLVLSDGGNLITMTNPAANTVTIPLNATVAFPIGTEIIIEQNGVGITTLAAIGGVTINTEGGFLNFAFQYTTVSLIKKAIDTWLVIGNLN